MAIARGETPDRPDPGFERHRPDGPDAEKTAQAPLPAVRRDLLISPQLYLGRVVYVIKDPVSLSYFRLQPAEHFIVTKLDGRSTAASLAEVATARFPDQPVTTEDVLDFVRMLHNAGLLLGRGDSHGSWLRNMKKRRRRKGIIAWIGHVMFLKIPLIDPDRLLAWLHDHLKFAMNQRGLIACLVFMLLSLGVVIPELPKVNDLAFPLLGWQNLMLLSVVFFIVKIIHEFGHGLAAKHRGLEVHEMGVLMMVVFPMFYVDTTDAWMVPRRRDRMWISAGGMFVELLLAAAAAWVWRLTDPGIVNQVAFNIMLAASVVTLLFNANPLLRYDGYYLLMDWLQIPNLRVKAGQFVSTLAKRHVLGMEVPDPPRDAARHPVLMPVYAVASWVYRWFITLGIIVVLWHLLDPYGLESIGTLLAAMAVLTMVLMPMWKMVKFLWGQNAAVSRRLGAMAMGAAGLLTLGVGIGSIPLEHTIEQPAVILATQRQQIYAPASGQIAELAVRSGQIVEAGEPILVMRNDKLADELANLQITRQLTMVERDGSRAAGKLDAVATQTAKLQQIEKDIAYHQAKLEQMVIRAPFAGRFQSPHRLEAMIGASLRQGDEIGLLLEDARRIVAVVVTQDDASMLEPGMAARVRLWGAPWQTWEATVKRVGTQFIEKLPHDALAADHKGEVDTVPSERYKSSPSQPSVLTTLELDSASALPSDGMTGRGKIVIGRSSLITQSMRTLRQVVSLDWWL